jgi:hypothetical protein
MSTAPDSDSILPPMARDWRLPIDAGRFPALRAAWNQSHDRVHSIRAALANASLPDGVECVGLAGSLARMEATEFSDCDTIVVLREHGEAETLYARFWEALAPLGLSRPKPAGIYAAPIRHVQLFAAPPGLVAEDMQTYGLRLQLLLEAQSVYGDGGFGALQRELVERFACEFIAADPRKEFTWLLNEVIRYFRSLWVKYQWEHLEDFPRWRLKQLKARHSRLVLLVGMLCLLGESSRMQGDKVEWLTTHLSLTPFERIAAAYMRTGDPHFERVAHCAEAFLSALSDPGFRAALASTEAEGSPIARERNASYRQLKQNSDALRRELVRFVLDRRNDWSERFFESLIL